MSNDVEVISWLKVQPNTRQQRGRTTDPFCCLLSKFSFLFVLSCSALTRCKQCTSPIRFSNVLTLPHQDKAQAIEVRQRVQSRNVYGVWQKRAFAEAEYVLDRTQSSTCIGHTNTKLPVFLLASRTEQAGGGHAPASVCWNLWLQCHLQWRGSQPLTEFPPAHTVFGFWTASSLRRFFQQPAHPRSQFEPESLVLRSKHFCVFCFLRGTSLTQVKTFASFKNQEKWNPTFGASLWPLWGFIWAVFSGFQWRKCLHSKRPDCCFVFSYLVGLQEETDSNQPETVLLQPKIGSWQQVIWAQSEQTEDTRTCTSFPMQCVFLLSVSCAPNDARPHQSWRFLCWLSANFSANHRRLFRCVGRVEHHDRLLSVRLRRNGMLHDCMWNAFVQEQMDQFPLVSSTTQSWGWPWTGNILCSQSKTLRPTI